MIALAVAMPLAVWDAAPASAQANWTTPSAVDSAVTSRATARRFDASIMHDASVVARKPSQTSSLKWRSSDRVASRRFHSGSTSNLADRSGPVMRVAYQQDGGFTDPLGNSETSPPASQQPPADRGNPFDDSIFNNNQFTVPPANLDAAPSAAGDQPDTLLMPEANDAASIPESSAQDSTGLPPAVLPETQAADPEAIEPKPLLPPTQEQRSDLDESKLDLFRNSPFKNDEGERTDSPSDLEGQDKTQTLPEFTPRRGFALQPPKQRANVSCDDLRAEVASRTIDRISLDISPAFRPDIIDDTKFAEMRESFDKNQKPRDWRSIDGALIARGVLKNLSYQDVVLRNESGGTQRIDISRLSEADLAFLSTEWGLPRVCRIEQVAYEGRHWTPAKMTWKASNLCHNPLYFEEVQLERYGHSVGPFQQPIISTAHFFVNIAVLPYKMGIHPATECQYALGYYRPGNCAPYLVPPIPLSLRGALSEAAVIYGWIGLIP